MPRVVSLFLPTWSTDRMRKVMGAGAPAHDVPFALKGMEGRKRVLVAVDEAALRAGLRRGMAVAKAQALIDNLAISDADPDGEAADLEKLALWALKRFSPFVTADPPDGLVIDATGAAHLHGGEEAMLHRLIKAFGDFGVTVHAGLADSWGAAHAVARFVANPAFVVPEGQSASVVTRLPLAALRISSPTIETLNGLGFKRIGELAAQPRAPFALRFGRELSLRIDQALGHTQEIIDPVRPAEIVEVLRDFAEPIAAAETISRYIGRLVEHLCERLEDRGEGVRRLDLLCRRVDNHVEAVWIGLSVPTRDKRRLTRLLSEKIEHIDPDWGIDQMRLAATHAEPLRPRQLTSALAGDDEVDVTALFDTLSNRIGGKNLYRFAPVASDVPERAVRRIAVNAPETGEGWHSRWPRPARIFSPPEEIQTLALLPDHPPRSFVWRGSSHRVRAADGPERIFGEFWKRPQEQHSVRDYFRVEDEAGERFWIYRAGDGEDLGTGSQAWFLHGIFA